MAKKYNTANEMSWNPLDLIIVLTTQEAQDPYDFISKVKPKYK